MENEMLGFNEAKAFAGLGAPQMFCNCSGSSGGGENVTAGRIGAAIGAVAGGTLGSALGPLGGRVGAATGGLAGYYAGAYGHELGRGLGENTSYSGNLGGLGRS